MRNPRPLRPLSSERVTRGCLRFVIFERVRRATWKRSRAWILRHNGGKFFLRMRPHRNFQNCPPERSEEPAFSETSLARLRRVKSVFPNVVTLLRAVILSRARRKLSAVEGPLHFLRYHNPRVFLLSGR